MTKIQYIRENDVTDLGVVFAEEEFDKDGKNPRVRQTGNTVEPPNVDTFET